MNVRTWYKRLAVLMAISIGLLGFSVVVNAAEDEGTKTLSGTVTYDGGSKDGLAVTTANIYAWRDDGWRDDDTSATGTYSLTLTGGSWEVCIGDQWDENGAVERDWFNNDSCTYVEFTDDSSVESQTLNWTVEEADARFTGVFKNSDGTFPEEGGWVSFWNNDHWFGGEVSSEDGSFSVPVVGGNSNTITASSLYTQAVGSTDYWVSYAPNSSSEKTYWDETEVDIETGETKSLGTITLSERDVAVSVTVTDSDGAAVEGIWVDGWQQDGGWTNGQTDSDGKVTLDVYEGEWEFQPGLWDRDDYIYASNPVKLEVDSGDSESIAFTLTPTTLTVTMNVVDANGSLVDLRGWASCWDQNGKNFGGNLESGTASFGAVAGDFECSAWIDSDEYMPGSAQLVTFVDGTDQTIEIEVADRSAELTVFLKDSDNNLIEDAEGWIGLWSNSGTWLDERIDGSETVINVGPGDWYVNVWFEEGTPYLNSHGWDSAVTIGDGESKTYTETVFAQSGTFTATLKDSSGSPVENAWVNCENWPELEGQIMGDFDGGRLISSGAESGVDGVAVVPMVEGHEYECWAGARPELELISPESEYVDLSDESDVAATMTFISADSTIEGEITLSGSEATIERNWCGAWNPEDGRNAWADGTGSSYSLAVVPGTWYVWCGTEVQEDGEYVFYHSQGDAEVTVSASGDVKTKNVTLEKSNFIIPESHSETIDGTQRATVTLEDGTYLDFPANSVVSDNFTFTAEPETGAHRTEDVPYGFPWNFEVYDTDGNLISGNFNSSVTINIPYDTEILEELGVEPEEVLPSTYNETTGAWEINEGFSLDTEAEVFVVTVEHFSQLGLVYNQSSIDSVPTKPKALKAKKIKKKRARLTWLAPTSGGVTKYKVQTRKCKNLKAKKCKKKKHYTKKKRWKKYKKVKKQVNRTRKRKVVKKLKKGTYYQFRVRACNNAGCGDFAKWKRFKTKGKRLK